MTTKTHEQFDMGFSAADAIGSVSLKPEITSKKQSALQKRSRTPKRRSEKLPARKVDAPANAGSEPLGTGSLPPVWLKVGDVARRFSISVPTVWRWAQLNNNFPSPYILSPGASRWLLNEIIDFERKLGVGSHD